MVVVSRNPVYSVLFLILAFFNAAALFLLIGAIVLTLRTRPGVRRQNIGDQINRTKEQSMTVVKVPTRGGV